MFGSRRVLVLLGVLAAVVGLTVSTPVEAREATTFYVSPTGSDSASGTKAEPWQTVEGVSQAALQAGDRVLFQRGGTYDGTLQITASGTATQRIVIGAYGLGELPTFTGGCVQLEGDYIDVINYQAK